ncbi:MAG: hypothetical protein QHC65_04235 [Sphingomonas sp.]|nr:hypothetical protein [Sphingomonas sp.]MDX3883607.1 hypothetical protein [Sphingomonas sp.]
MRIRRMQAADMIAIERQPSQRVQLGIERTPTLDEAEDLAGEREAWTAEADDGRLLACFGIRETFPDRQGVAWAVLATGIGGAHVGITRAARRMIERSRLARIEALARLSIEAECRWPTLVGLQPLAILRKFGAASEDHVLFERIG